MPTNTTRRAPSLLIALLALALVAGCAGRAAGPPPAPTASVGSAGGPADVPSGGPTLVPSTRVIVAYPARVVTMTGFYIAIERGYTREEGLDAEMVLMNGTLSAQGLVAGQVDFGMSAGALVAASLRGAPLKNVFVQIDKPLYSLFAQPEIHSIAGLAGKPVGITAVGDSTHLAAMAALSGAGVDPSQVTFITGLNGSQALAGLQAGAVAAAVTSPPVDVNSERLGYRNLAFLGDYLDYLTAGLGTHEDTIRTRPALVRAVVRAELKAHRYMQQNRAGTIEHMARFQEVPVDDAALAYDRYLRYLTVDGQSPPDRLARILTDQRHELGVDHPVPVEAAFDLSFARDAAADLDRAGWKP